MRLSLFQVNPEMSRSFALVTRVAGWPDPIFSTNTLSRFSQGCRDARYSPFGESEYATLSGFRKKSFTGISGGTASVCCTFRCAEVDSGMSSRSCISTKTIWTFDNTLWEAQLDVGHFLRTERRRTEFMLILSISLSAGSRVETVVVFIESSNASVKGSSE